MKKIKVLRIISRLNIGGPAIHAALLTEGLNSGLDFESTLVCGSISEDEGDMSYFAREMGVEPIFIPQLKRELNLFNDLISFLKILKLVIIKNPDIIHTHTAKAGTLGRLAGITCNIFNLIRIKNIKLVHTFHGHVFEGYFSPLKARIFIFIERILACFTCRIITISRSLRSKLISLGITGPEKIIVIYLGFELSEFLRVPPSQNLVLNIGIVGRLVPIKNHRLFLEAAAELKKRGIEDNVKFKVIGDGELRKEMEDYCFESGLRDRVEFLGWRRNLASVYADLDIVVLTSLNEGTPVSIIEAMASARPVVATDVGGVADILGGERKGVNSEDHIGYKILQRGIIFRSEDLDGLVAALQFLLNDRDLGRDIGIQGRQYVKQAFSRERLLQDIGKLYKDFFTGS